MMAKSKQNPLARFRLLTVRLDRIPKYLLPYGLSFILVKQLRNKTARLNISGQVFTLFKDARPGTSLAPAQVTTRRFYITVGSSTDRNEVNNDVKTVGSMV